MSLKRFYYDDGVKRTFWYVQNRGTLQTVTTGKLGSKGRITIKDFGNSADARKDTRRKIERKLENGFIQYEPDQLMYRKRFRFFKKFALSRLKAIEEDYSIKIPAEVRKYWLNQNGGHPEPGFISIPGHPHIENVSVDTILGLETDPAFNLRWYIEETSPSLPKGHLPVAGMPDLFSVALNRNRGAVYFWDFGSIDMDEVDDEGNYALKHNQGYLLAHSFDEFLTRLARYPDDISQSG